VGFAKKISAALALNFLALFAMTFDLMSCFRFSLFLALCYFVAFKPQQEAQSWSSLGEQNVVFGNTDCSVIKL